MRSLVRILALHGSGSLCHLARHFILLAHSPSEGTRHDKQTIIIIMDHDHSVIDIDNVDMTEDEPYV